MTQAPAAGLDAVSIRVHRKGSGPTLVLLHCLGVDHGLWDIAAAGLEDSFTLLSYDFPGHERRAFQTAATPSRTSLAS
jgi:pimeloyl-ACP methyl ester carboxylesterase